MNINDLEEDAKNRIGSERWEELEPETQAYEIACARGRKAKKMFEQHQEMLRFIDRLEKENKTPKHILDRVIQDANRLESEASRQMDQAYDDKREIRNMQYGDME